MNRLFRNLDRAQEVWMLSKTEDSRDDFIAAIRSCVKYHARRIFRGVHPSVESEIVSKVMEATEKFEGSSKFSTYASRVIINACNDELRIMQAYEGRAYSLDEDIKAKDVFLSIERRVDMGKFLNRLPTEERALLKLFIQGYTFAEISNRVGWKYESTARKHITAIFDKLQKFGREKGHAGSVEVRK